MELEAFHCPRWEELPQLALYMDQVLLVLSTAFAPLSAGQPPVTASMINNYVKLKLTAPAEKKKYNREHLARFVMICLFKKVLSMQEIAAVLERMLAGQSLPAAYDRFAAELERLLAAPDAPMPQDSSNCVALAIRAVACKLWVEADLAKNNP